MSVPGFEIQISLVELQVKLTRKDFLLSFKLDSSPPKRSVLIMSEGSEECAVEIHGGNKDRRQCNLGAVAFISGDDCAAECSGCITRRAWLHIHDSLDRGGEEGGVVVVVVVRLRGKQKQKR